MNEIGDAALKWGSRWKHLESGLTYTCFGTAECATNGWEGERSVLYAKHAGATLFYRTVPEFLDGRFQNID